MRGAKAECRSVIRITECLWALYGLLSVYEQNPILLVSQWCMDRTRNTLTKYMYTQSLKGTQYIGTRHYIPIIPTFLYFFFYFFYFFLYTVYIQHM